MKINGFDLKNWKSSPTIALIALVLGMRCMGFNFPRGATSCRTHAGYGLFSRAFLFVAAAAMFALRPTCLRGVTRQELGMAVALGIALGLAYITQTYGLLYTSATVSGFITGMYVVFTPVISWIIFTP